MNAADQAGFAERDPDDLAVDLWPRLRGDRAIETREALFSLYYPFARRIARRHWRGRTSPEVELTELNQMAGVGLLEALDRFDPQMGTQFKAFARRRIAGSILDGIAKLSEFREQVSYRNRIRGERARSLAPVAADSLSTSQALDALADMALGLALGFVLEDGAFQGAADQPDSAASPYESLAWKQVVGRMMSELEGLPDRSRAIIRLHYLDGVPFEQIAAIQGVSKGRISQIHGEALGYLRKRMAAAGAAGRKTWDVA
ncbi:MAG: hypothetical protein JWM33_3830 [Caulobacteraceae bacterium]|nr:hypothetical protein [Caulobacteraceae bacterium]